MPNDYNGYENLGSLYENLEKYDKAEEYYLKVIQLKYDNFSGYWDLGRLYEKLKKYDESLKYYNKTIELAPDVDWLKDRRNYVLKKIEYEPKINKYETILNNDITSYQNISNELLETYLDDEYFYDSAVEVYKKVIQKYPNDDAYFKLGYSYGRLSDYDNAIAAYKKSAELFPNEATYYNIGLQYEDKQQYNEALKYYNKSLEIDPKYELALKGRERVLSKLKEQK